MNPLVCSLLRYRQQSEIRDNEDAAREADPPAAVGDKGHSGALCSARPRGLRSILHNRLGYVTPTTIHWS